MYACYHTHTARCMHAIGTDEEYVRVAIAEGVKVLGFSDHAPMRYRNGYKSYYKMTLAALPEYCASILSLKEKYADKIEIHLGFESEYYPSLWEDSLEFWSNYPIEYLLLGQHFVGEETDEIRDPSPAPGMSEAKRIQLLSTSNTNHAQHDDPNKVRLTRYTDIVITAINTGRFTYIAHPDILNYSGKDIDFYRSEADRLILEAKRLGLPLEYNLLGMSDRRAYPNPVFWEEVGKLGAPAIIGCDAHEPYRVADPKELARATRFLEKCGANLVDRVTLVDPFKR